MEGWAIVSSDHHRAIRFDCDVAGFRLGTRSRRANWIAVTVALLAITMAVALPMSAALGVLALAVPFIGAALAARRTLRGQGTLEVTDSHVALVRNGHPTALSWASVAHWEIRPRGDRDELVVESTHGDLLVAELVTEEQSAAVVEAAKTAESLRSMTMTLVPAARTWREVSLVGAAVAAAVVMNSEMDAAGSAGAGVVCLLAVLAAVAWLVRLRDVARVAVGRDGVALARGGTLRFIPYGDLAEVDWDEYGVNLELRDGDEVTLPVVNAEGLRDPRDASVARMMARRDALHDRVRSELARWRSSPVTHQEQPATALLDRQGRSLTAWQAGLRELVSVTGQGYRRVSLDREDVTRIVEDPRASVERRVAAVMALAPEGDADVRARVRAVVDGCALDPVRVAIDRAACGELDEDTLDVALLSVGERGIW